MGRKRILIFISSLVIFFIIQQFCVVYAATALDTELVTNGSGETESISGWTDDTGQSRWSSSTMSALFTASPADGSHYFFLYNPSMASLSGSMSQVITLSGTEGSGLFSSISNGTVSIKFSISMFQAISTGNEAKAVLEEYDASGALIKSSEVVNTTASGSTMGSYQINTQVNPNTRKFKIILSASLTRGGYDLFDKVSLQLVDASAGSAPVFGNDFPASAETDQNITYGPVPFTISDADPGDIDKLTFSASSTNINVIPVSNISFGGSGANRTITIVPVSGLSGEADITVSASDGTKSSENTFHFTVHKVISMNTNLVENGNAASGFEKWSGSNVNITATGNGFRIISQGYGMSQNIDISKFSALINGGETEFQMSAAFSAANGNVSAQFYSDIACTKPIDNSKYLVNNSTASLQQNIPVNAKGVAISFIDTVGYDPITIQNISFKIINDFPKISAISAQTTNLSQLTVPVNAYYTTSSATLTATSSNQMVVPNSGITIGGSGFNQTVTFTPLTNGNITINLTLSDGTKSTSASFSVTALEPASVSGVVSPTSGIYTEGSNLDFTVHFNHDIQGGEDSRLPLNIGGNSVYMSYLSSTANSITYRYTIGSTDSGTVAIGSAIDDSSSPIKDTAGYAALKTINDSMKMTGITVVQAPVVSSPAGSYTYGDKITFTATLCTNSLTGTIQFKANGNNIGTPITVSGNTATYETTETELDAGTVSITAEYVPSDANVYFTSLTSIDYNITINKKTVSIDGLSAASKVYDGTRDVSLTGGTINGVLNGDKLTANIPTSGLASQKNAGTQAVTFDTILLDGADKDNYSLSVQPSVSVNITPKSVTPSATAANKEYDGKTETTVQFSFATGDIVTGDDITVSAIGTFADANVGTGKEVTLSNFTMDGADKNNYDIGMPGGLKADISPRGIEVTPDPVTKVYGQPDTALTYKITSGSVVAGESLKGNLLRVVGENAGEYEITQGTLTNANNPNYDIKLVKGQKLTITQETPTITVSVNKSVQKTGRDVVVTATLNYPNKQDDDAYPATVAFTATNAVSKGAVTVNGNIYSQTFTMGNDLTKDATFNAEVGANGNYKDASSTKSATVSIIERYTPDVAVSSNIASNNATYGTAVTLIATVSDSNGTPKGKVQFYVDGIVYGSETTLAADGTAKISTAAAPLKAGDRNITAQYLSADGETDYWSNSSSNYLFIVDKKPVSIVGLTAVTKVYDGTTQVDLTGGTISGVLTGDTLNVNIPVTGSVLTKTAEAGKAVSFTTIVLSGADKDNYELNSQPTVTATITARPITAAAVVSSKVYDGTTDSVVVLSFNKTDLIGSDQLTATVSAAFTDMNTGTGKAVSLSNLVTGGSDCDNYKVNLPTNLTADISPLSIEITPDLLTKVYGQTDPAFTYHVTKGSLVSGDALNGSLSRESGEDTGNFAIKQGTLTSANNTNYSISFVSGAVLAITQATPAIVVTSNKTSGSAIYGDAVTFTTTVSGTGGTPKGSVQFKLDGTAIGSETALINGTASLATAKTQLSAGNYSITVQYLPATDEINFKTNTSDPYAIMVNKREITVKADDKTIYIGDAIPVGSTLTYTVSGLVGSDSLKTAPTLSLPADVSTSAVKVYTISITGAAANDNYTVKMVDGKLNVVQHESGLGSSANKPVTPTESNTVAVEVNATVDSQGSATATVNENQLTDAVHKAVESAAQTDGNTAVQVEIKVNAQAEAKSVETNIPKTFLNNTAADSSITGLTITTPIAAINFDSNALGTISGEASGDLKITASKVDTATLSDETQQAVGDRPVFNFSVTSSGNTISQFNGNVSVSVPYKPKAGEDPDSIVIYYITANGSLQIVNNCSYDTGTGMVTFNTRHFSTYAVGYNKVNFKDVAKNAWYSKSVSFIAARGITTGTGNGNYSPNAKLTRGEFLVMMMRAYGIAPDTDLSNNFSDAGSTYYTGYLAAAKRLGIAGGVGNNKFVPDKEITRQEMFTLLYNALKTTGQLPTGNSGKQLSAFSDAGQVTSWAKDAMVLFVQTGTIDGSGGKLSPTITTTRAEMAQVLYNLLTKQ